MSSIALITTYHFNSGNADAYARLIRSLRGTAKQLSNDDRLLLVPNGDGDTVEDPDKVLKDVDPSHADRIIPVVMLKNLDIAGGLNVGISAALRLKTDWIGQVQSSVVIGATWLGIMRDQAQQGTTRIRQVLRSG